MDAQLAQCEAHKRDIEQRLSSVGSTLRRIAGIQLDGSVAIPYRLLSPSRRWSPARGGTEYVLKIFVLSLIKSSIRPWNWEHISLAFDVLLKLIEK